MFSGKIFTSFFTFSSSLPVCTIRHSTSFSVCFFFHLSYYKNMPGYHFMLMLLLGASITAHVQVEAFASTWGIDINNAIYTRKKVPLSLYKYCLVSSSKLFSKRRTNRSRSDENNHEQSDGNVSKMPQLPPSSGRSSISTTTTSNVEDDPPLVSRKFQLSYTCKVCETRNTHMVSRIGKLNGVRCCGNVTKKLFLLLKKLFSG